MEICKGVVVDICGVLYIMRMSSSDERSAGHRAWGVWQKGHAIRVNTGFFLKESQLFKHISPVNNQLFYVRNNGVILFPLLTSNPFVM